jgi:SDR family mycofactocin-dependent oxidoreductase
LDNKVALITGAARGQGRSHAVKMAAEGADIIAVDVCEQINTVPFPMSTEEDLQETVRLVEERDRRIFARKTDVRDLEGLTAAVDAGVAELGRLDIVVANAGIASVGAVGDLSSEQWQDMVDVNQTGVWHTCKVAVPHLRAHGDGGSIVITSSTAGLHGFANLAHYVAAKHGLVGLMRVLAVELGPERIRVNTIHPTQTNTPMLMNEQNYALFCPSLDNPGPDDLARASQAMHTLPVPWVEPEDISNAIIFLTSDEGRYITGVTLSVDAGADLIG